MSRRDRCEGKDSILCKARQAMKMTSKSGDRAYCRKRKPSRMTEEEGIGLPESGRVLLHHHDEIRSSPREKGSLAGTITPTRCCPFSRAGQQLNVTTLKQSFSCWFAWDGTVRYGIINPAVGWGNVPTKLHHRASFIRVGQSLPMTTVHDPDEAISQTCGGAAEVEMDAGKCV